MNENVLLGEFGGIIRKALEKIKREAPSPEIKNESIKLLLELISSKHTNLRSISSLHEKFWYMVYRVYGDDPDIEIPEFAKKISERQVFNRFGIFKYEPLPVKTKFYSTIMQKIMSEHKDKIKKEMEGDMAPYIKSILMKVLTEEYRMKYRSSPPPDVIEQTLKEFLEY